MLHRLLRNCVMEDWFEIITEPELRVNVDCAFISTIAVMENTRFLR